MKSQKEFFYKMNQYEVTFIVDPVLSGDEIKSTAEAYNDLLKNEGCNIVHTDDLGLKQLAYPINKRSSGVYYCIEFNGDNGDIIPKLELALRRDERIMRYLTVKLDKYGIKYNDDKRAGKIGKVEPKKKKKKSDSRGGKSAAPYKKKEAQAAPVKETPVASNEEE